MKVSKFKVANQNGEFVEASSWKGQYRILYFYPKDMTSGCTVEAQEFQKKYKKFRDLGVEVVGVSRDSVKSHQKFCEKEGITFTLLSDENEDLCNQFSVLKEKSMYGKKYLGIERSTFLVGPDLKVIYEWRGVKVAGHVDEVLKKVQEILS